MNKKQYLNDIIKKLAILSKEIELNNSQNLTDINISTEDFVKDLLNLTFGYNFININETTKNAPSIDLVDNDKKVAVQVTSSSTTSKIKDTVTKFVEHDWYLKYTRLIIFNISKISKYQKDTIGNEQFSISTKTDIWNFDYIINKIKHKETSFLKKISNFISEELSLNNKNLELPINLSSKFPKYNIDNFVGRTSELEKLHMDLFTNKNVVLVNGIGGIGKTSFAQLYSQKYYNFYKHFIWIDHLSDNIISDIINTEGLLTNFEISKENKNEKEIFLELVNNLNYVNTGPNLIIFDNINSNFSKIYNYLPNSKNWHILATSRSLVEKMSNFEIDFLPHEDAKQLFLKYYTNPDVDLLKVDQILKKIDYHTLTIELFAKTAQRQFLELDHLYDSFKSDIVTNVYTNHKDGKTGKIFTYISSIFSYSDLKNEEIWLLKQFTCLPPQYHHYNDLIQIFYNHNSENIGELLHELYERGWLLTDHIGNFKMHRIIQEVTTAKLAINFNDTFELRSFLEKKLYYDPYSENHLDSFNWINYGKNFYDVYADDLNIYDTDFLYNLTQTMYYKEDYFNALEILEKEKNILIENYGKDFVYKSTSYTTLGLVHTQLGNYCEAEIVFENIIKHNIFISDLDLATNYSNLSLPQIYSNQYDKALDNINKAIKIEKKYFDENNVELNKSYQNLALCYSKLNKNDKAVELFLKVSEVYEKTYSENNLITALSYYNLGCIYKKIKKIDDSIYFYHKAFKSYYLCVGLDNSKINEILNVIIDYIYKVNSKEIKLNTLKSIVSILESENIDNLLLLIKFRDLYIQFSYHYMNYDIAMKNIDKNIIFFEKYNLDKILPYVEVLSIKSLILARKSEHKEASEIINKIDNILLNTFNMEYLDINAINDNDENKEQIDLILDLRSQSLKYLKKKTN